jgi:hypothetical protein
MTAKTEAVATKFLISRTGAPDLAFQGEEIASASTRWVRGQQQNRWHELTLYQTTGGKFVAAREYITQWQGESGETEARVCESEADVIEFFGQTDAAKEIYSGAKIPNLALVD